MDEFSVTSRTVTTIHYDRFSEIIVDGDLSKALSQEVIVVETDESGVAGETKRTFYLKYYGWGVNRDMVVDPYDNPNYHLIKEKDHALGRTYWGWRQVKPETYVSYQAYLKDGVRSRVMWINRLRGDA